MALLAARDAACATSGIIQTARRIQARGSSVVPVDASRLGGSFSWEEAKKWHPRLSIVERDVGGALVPPEWAC